MFTCAALYVHMVRMQINAGDYGGRPGAAGVYVQNWAQVITHCTKPLQKSPSNQQQLPLLRQSSPGINKPQIPLILEMLPAVQWTGLKAALGQPHSRANTLIIYSGSAVIIMFMAMAYQRLLECSSYSCAGPCGCPRLWWRFQHAPVAH